MSEEKKYRNYSAADIEKYHKGLLSPKEMNEMERAALDDPFLADAMEGYDNVKTNITADISELEKKLEERINEGKVVRMAPPFNIYRALKVAAVVVLIAGGGLLVYQFGFNRSNNSIAKEVVQQTPKQQEVRQTDTTARSADVASDSINKSLIGNTGTITYQWKAEGNKNAANKNVNNFTVSSGAAMAPQKDSSSIQSLTADINIEKKPTDDKEIRNKDVSATSKSSAVPQNKNLNEVVVKVDSIRSFKKESENAFAVTQLDSKRKLANNYFNGRVIDNNKNAVPFANVTNIRDNVGTYADANGYFTLISPDTALDLRIKSVGFQNDTVQLRNSTAVNQVMLKEDKMNGIVLGKKRLGKIPTPEDNIKVEEPEPADGWSNYGLYLANNLQVPDQVKGKNVAGEVQVSFEVNQLGEPTNIKVEKSLCKECDEEAKRLIQQGPKWKLKKKKNNRVTVTVPFEVKE